jgi:hypothetical protein
MTAQAIRADAFDKLENGVQNLATKLNVLSFMIDKLNNSSLTEKHFDMLYVLICEAEEAATQHKALFYEYHNAACDAEGKTADPLLAMLERHDAANRAFDLATKRGAGDRDQTRLFAVCSETMEVIRTRRPPATTAAGAIAAIDVILNDPEWRGPDLCPGEDFHRHLLTAARDYIKRSIV